MLLFKFKNDQMIKKRNSRGQAFPFLLIGMIGLLATTFIATSKFNGYRAKTCADNAADAAALATGSILAGGFNDLCLRNKDMWEYYFNKDLPRYTTMHNASVVYFDEAIDYSKKAETSAKLALDNIYKGGCETWTWQKTASEADYKDDAAINSAAEYALEAAKCVGAVQILTMYMWAFTNNYKINQFDSYCEASGLMVQTFQNAKDTGKQYGFSNSCTSGDAFSNWLSSGGYKDSDRFYTTDETYTKCWVEVQIHLPDIDSIEIVHGKWNFPKKRYLTTPAITCIGWPGKSYPDDPFNSEITFDIREIYRAISNALKTASASAKSIYDYTDGAHIIYDTCGCDDTPPNCHDCNPHCDRDLTPANTASDNLYVIQECLYNALHYFNGDSGSGLPNLKKINQDIFDKVWHPSGDFYSNKANYDDPSAMCKEVREYVDESEYPGLMIMKIDEVVLTWAEWKTDSYVEVQCMYIDPETGKVTYGPPVTATAIATFDGGSVRDFLDNFDTEIIATS